MPQPRYITSDSQMEAPGVYIKENAPAVPIRGQRNRNVGFVGQCCRGPVGVVVLCDTYQRFIDVFGGRDLNSNGGAVVGQVWKALQRKRWGRVYVVRAAATAAVAADFELNSLAAHGGTNIVNVVATSPGLWGNDVMIKVLDASDGDVTHWNLSVLLYGKSYLFENIDTSVGKDNTNQVVGNDYATLIKITKLVDGRPVNNVANTDGADANGYVKLGQVVAGYVSTPGSDGVIADTDFQTPINTLSNYAGVNMCAVAGRSNTAVKGYVSTAAATASQRVWFVCPDNETIAEAAAVTERATLNSQRMSYWFNHAYITDPVTGEQVIEEPFLYVMSILSQTDPDVHPGDFDNVSLTATCKGLYNALGDTDRDTLSKGGVSFMNRDLDQFGNDVILPGNALTCDFSVNNRDLDGRYMKDFILDAVAQRLRGDQFKGNTPANRAARSSAVSSFLEDLARSQRYVQTDDNQIPQYQYINDSSVNSVTDQATGLQKELLICQLIPKNIQIELNATIGVDALISEL